MPSLFSMPFFYRSFAALLVSGLAYPVLGTFILNLELISARFAVMHAALLGGAAALLLGVNPLWLAMGASFLSGIAIALFSWKRKVSAGASLGLIMTLCLGVSFIIFYKSNIHAIEAFNLFWGNILALTSGDMILSLIISGLICLFLLSLWKEIHIVLYDRELAQATGVRAKPVYALIMLSVCLGMAAAMRVTGALLVDAVTILPALAARQLGKNFKGLILWGGFFGLLMNMGGFGLSFLFDLPVSPAIIVTGAGIIFLLRGLKALAAIGINIPGGETDTIDGIKR
jgi:zinc transport system permease protein